MAGNQQKSVTESDEETEIVIEGEASEEGSGAELGDQDKLAVERYIDSNVPLTVEQIKEHSALMHKVLKEVMVKDQHYGIIPGTDKPALFQPGAQIINVTFKLVPTFEMERIPRENGHLDFSAKCLLRNRAGVLITEGEGYCSTMESKYRYRNASRICPDCGQTAVIKGKAEYGGGWICFKKKGGCGAKWTDGSSQGQIFDAMVVGRVENEDIADCYNTVKKIACKRAMVAADINATASSDLFTQDEDYIRKMNETVAAQSPGAEKPSKPSGDTVTPEQPAEAVSGDVSQPGGKLAHGENGQMMGVPNSVGEELITENQYNDVLALLQDSSLNLKQLNEYLSEKTQGNVTDLKDLKVKALTKVCGYIVKQAQKQAEEIQE